MTIRRGFILGGIVGALIVFIGLLCLAQAEISRNVNSAYKQAAMAKENEDLVNDLAQLSNYEGVATEIRHLYLEGMISEEDCREELKILTKEVNAYCAKDVVSENHFVSEENTEKLANCIINDISDYSLDFLWILVPPEKG